MNEVAQAFELLKRRIAVVERETAIGPFTTYRLGGPAALFVEAASEEDLAAVGEAAFSTGLKCLVIGRGSNLLVSDEGYPGICVRLGGYFERLARADSGVRAGSAVPMPKLANWAARRSLSGVEFGVAIPGSVGGAIRMNAGAHERDISSLLIAARVFSLQARYAAEVPAWSLNLSYRHSALGDDDVVTEASFRLESDSPSSIAARMQAYRAHRVLTQPAEAPNAGSMFKNPPGDRSGRVIEACGLKGLRAGNVEVSERHANFFLARPGARAQEVYDLLAEVQAQVQARCGILLEPEIRVAGSFRGAKVLMLTRDEQ